jgi:hypothetical protein
MKIVKSTKDKDGSCDFCDRGVLSEGGRQLIFPYKTIFVLHGTGIRVNMCRQCITECKE